MQMKDSHTIVFRMSFIQMLSRMVVSHVYGACKEIC